jgi:predicted PP-loop superfamily ATPase
MQEQIKKFEDLFNDVKILKDMHERTARIQPKKLFGMTIDPRISIDGMVVVAAIIGGVMSYANLQAQQKTNTEQIAIQAHHLETLDEATASIAQSLAILTTTVVERTGRPIEEGRK